MFFDDWTTLGEIVVLTVLVYTALVVVLRMTGKRTTSKMNSFDWVVTVALGSMVSTVILVDEVPLVEGVAGITALVLMQYTVAFGAVRIPWFQSLVKASPRLLYYRGEFNDETMRRERLTREEVLASVRTQGYTSMDEVSAVVLETNADLSILPADDDDKRPGVLSTVEGDEL